MYERMLELHAYETERWAAERAALLASEASACYGMFEWAPWVGARPE